MTAGASSSTSKTATDVLWARQGSCRYWPALRQTLDDVTGDDLRRQLQEQARKLQAKHPSRRTSGGSPTDVLVEFFGSHDYAWVQSSKVVAFHAAKDAPDGPTRSGDEYTDAVNRLTGYSGAVQEAEEYCRMYTHRRGRKRPVAQAASGAAPSANETKQRKPAPSPRGRASATSSAKRETHTKAATKPGPSDTVTAIAALNTQVAKQLKAASQKSMQEGEGSMGAAGSTGAGPGGRSRRASTAAISRATAQAELTRQLQRGLQR